MILPQSGALRNRLDGVVAEAGKMVFASYRPELELDIANSKILLVSLNSDAVWSALGQRFQKLPPIQGWHSAPTNSATVETLRSMAVWLGTEVDRPGSPLALPGKARLHAERLLLSLFTECMAEVVLYETEAIPGVSERHVRRAEEWIDAHLTEIIGVEDVAAALGVGVRSLQSVSKGCGATHRLKASGGGGWSTQERRCSRLSRERPSQRLRRSSAFSSWAGSRNVIERRSERPLPKLWRAGSHHATPKRLKSIEYVRPGRADHSDSSISSGTKHDGVTAAFHGSASSG